MNIFETLTLRSEFEEITLNYKIPGDNKPGTIRNLKWFTKYAAEKNKKKEGFNRALEIANIILQDEAARRERRKRRK